MISIIIPAFKNRSDSWRRDTLTSDRFPGRIAFNKRWSYSWSQCSISGTAALVDDCRHRSHYMTFSLVFGIWMSLFDCNAVCIWHVIYHVLTQKRPTRINRSAEVTDRNLAAAARERQFSVRCHGSARAPAAADRRNWSVLFYRRGGYHL